MNASTPSIREYLRIIFRRKWALLLPILPGVVAALLVWNLAKPQYLTTASLRLRDYGADRAGPAGLIGRTSSPRSGDILHKEVYSRPMMEEIVRRIQEQYPDVEWRMGSQQERDKTFKALQSSLRVNISAQAQGDQIIDFQVVHSDPQLAYHVANIAAEAYKSRVSGDDATGGEKALQFLRERVEEYKTKVEEVEARIVKFRKEHFSDLPAVKQNIRSRLLSLRIDKAARQTQLQESKGQLAEVEEQLDIVPRTEESRTVEERNPAVVELEERLRLLKRQLRNTTGSAPGSYTDSHPEVRRLRENIADLEAELAETPEWIEVERTNEASRRYIELLNRLSELKGQIKGHEAALMQTEALISAHLSELSDVQAQEAEYNDLLRKQSDYESRYTSYRNRLLQAEDQQQARQQQTTVEVEFLQKAPVPTLPTARPKIKLAGACLLASIAAGIGLMFAVEFSDRSFRGIEDASNYLKQTDAPQVDVLASVQEIVTPAHRRAKRVRRFGILMGIVVLAFLTYGGLTAWRVSAPGSYRAFWGTVREEFNNVIQP